MPFKYVKDMSAKEKKELRDEVIDRKNAYVGSSKILSDSIVVIKFGYTNSYQWTIIGWNKETGYIKYGYWCGEKMPERSRFQ